MDSKQPTDPAIARDFALLDREAGFCLLEDRLIVRMVGDDRVAFMHGMCTANIKALRVGQVAPALFLTDRAHLIADCFVYCLADALWLELNRALWPTLRAHLDRYLVADDVEMEEMAQLAVVALEGPRAAAALGELGLAPPAVAWGWDTAGGLANLPRFGRPAFTAIVERARWPELAARMRSVHCAELRPATLEVIRVEQGLALVGVDTNDRTLALEAAFQREISFDKGCYIGQETVERATARGGIKRRLMGLRIAAEDLPPRGCRVLLDSAPVGMLTSVVWSPRHAVIGLAILHHSAWTPGTVVSLELPAGALAATVVEVPFA
ncbi:MAG TPA: glycine cleavage T C-terminal barrel domain-containing protein [Candidatus Binataceae bacterium]|nr:glycine cleavage T C-terminal barrel domain-containing protein [Candidatus Binataceae bacterium]